MKNSYTVFEYLYCDAGNHKAWGMILLSGQAVSGDLNTLRANLESEEFFIAEQVGLPVLYQSLWSLSGGPNSDDHAFHKFHDLRPATNEDISTMKIWGGVTDLLKNFCEANNNWNCTLSPNCWL